MGHWRLATRRTTASTEAQLHVGASATRVSPDIKPSSSFALHTEHKEHTHNERNISAMQHFAYTLKGVRSSDACLNLESHASAKTSLDVPPRLNPMKAKTVRMETGHISHTHVFGGFSCKLERRQHVFRQRSHLILLVYCTPNIKDTH